jgi:hypothetical protein
MTALPLRTTQHLPPILTLKALLMAHYQPQRTLEAIVKLMLSAPAFSVPTAQFLGAQNNLMDTWNANHNNGELGDKLATAQVPVDQQIHALNAAPLENKRIVLASMPIIDGLCAACFLGIPQHAFDPFNMFYHDIFGQQYMNQRRYSLDELTLIASNPEWLSNHRKSFVAAATPKPVDPLLHRWTVVEEKVAMAFCNITRDELPKVAYVTNKVPAYYLADLDEIRVAKLKTH